MKKLLLALTLFTLSASAQVADCKISFQFTTTGDSPVIDNRQSGCILWAFSYQSSGFSALSIIFQTADGAVTPGTYGTFGGTTISGANPSTNTTAASALFTGTAPAFARMRLNSITGTGTVTGTLFGYKTAQSANAVVISGNVTVVQPTAANLNATVVQATAANLNATVIARGAAASGAALSGNPVRMGGSDGANTQNIFTDASGKLANLTYGFGTNLGASPIVACDGRVFIAGAAAATTLVLNGVSTKVLFICGFAISGGAVGTFRFISGTGATCGTGTTNASGLFTIGIGSQTSFGNGVGIVVTGTAAGDNLCIVTTGAGATANGQATFTVF